MQNSSGLLPRRAIPIPGGILEVAMASSAPGSIEEVQRHAFEPQQLVVLAVVDADDHQRDLEGRRAAVEQPPRGLGDVDPVVAGSVVAARSQVVLAGLARRRRAMARPAIAG